MMSQNFFTQFRGLLAAMPGPLSHEVDGRMQLGELGKLIYGHFFARHGLQFDPAMDEDEFARQMEPLWEDWNRELEMYAKERLEAAVAKDYRAQAHAKLVQANLYQASGMSPQAAAQLRQEADDLMRRHLLAIIDGDDTDNGLLLSDEEIARIENYRALARELKSRELPIPGIDTPVIWF